MNEAEWGEFCNTCKRNMRGYADRWSWESDREVAELGVVQDFYESLEHSGQAFFHSYQARGRGKDPPDCEARSLTGGRIAIEVTELVDGEAIAKAKSGEATPWEPLTREQLFDQVATRLTKKDNRENVQDGPYDEYILVILEIGHLQHEVDP